MSTLSDQLLKMERHNSIFESAVRALPLPVCAAFGDAVRPQPVAFAASGLILVAIEGLAHLVFSTDLSRISLAARTDILTRSGMLGLGVWAASYALRADRRSAAS